MSPQAWECSVDDPLTKVIGVYVEDIKDGPAFRNALRDAARAKKPVFLIKAGRSLVGAAAAASHTGAIAGEDRVYQACFDQFGAVRVASITEMIDAAKLVLHGAVPADGRIGVLSVSGGAGVMLADAIESVGLGFPAFRSETAKALSATLPSYSKPHNPVDLTANVLANTEMFRKTLAVISGAVELDACILFIGLMHSISKVLTEFDPRGPRGKQPVFHRRLDRRPFGERRKARRRRNTGLCRYPTGRDRLSAGLPRHPRPV